MWRQKQEITERKAALPLILQEGEFALFDFGRIEAGFFKAAFESLADSTLVIAFSELFEGEEEEVSGGDGGSREQGSIGNRDISRKTIQWIVSGTACGG